MENDVTPERRLAEPQLRTVASLWRSAVDLFGDVEAARKDGRGLTFREMDERSAALARGLLAQGVGKGGRVGLLLPNGPEWTIAWLAINRIGAVAVLLSTLYSTPELAHSVGHADVELLISADRYLRHDYVKRIEAAFAGLSEADGRPLALAEAPYLRSIWLGGETRRGWSRGTLADLERLGRGSADFGPAMLAAVEANVAPADWALMIYTSGSTSKPKAVVHSNGAAVDKVLTMCRGNGMLPSCMANGDRPIITAPFFWVGGFLAMAGAIANGATTITVDDHGPSSLLRTIRNEGATHCGNGGPLLVTLETSPDRQQGDLERLKPQTPSQQAFFARRRGGQPERIVRPLGMTETLGPHSGYADGQLCPPGAVDTAGPALPGVEWRIVDPETGRELPSGAAGELHVRTPWDMVGIYRKERAEVFGNDGFYPTGDRCTLDEDGFLRFDARLGGMIKTHGANVSPDEVEAAIRRVAEIAEVAVFGLPDEQLGAMVVAVVAPLPGSAPDEAAMRARLKDELSSFKVPRRILFYPLEQIPRTASNKVHKPGLTEMIAEHLRRESAP